MMHWRRRAGGPDSGNALCENIEAVVMAVVMALIIRQYAFEAFKIPTGSMAPTLLGAHEDVTCPNCGYRFSIGEKDNRPVPLVAYCPNCRYRFDETNLDHFTDAATPFKPTALLRRGEYRILVNKFVYTYQEPQRWDIAVFRYPYVTIYCPDCNKWMNVRLPAPARCPDCGGPVMVGAKKDYVKRLVGLPGEKLLVRGGDIYIDGRRLRKPPEVQKQLWQFDYDMNYVEKDPSFHAPWWRARAGTARLDGATLHVAPDARGRALVQFDRPIVNHRAYNGWDWSKLTAVGDLKVEADVTAATAGVVRFEVLHNRETTTAEVAVGSGQTVLKRNHETVAHIAWALPAGSTHHLAFQNVDGALALFADGAPILEYAPDPQASPPEVPYNKRASGLALSADDTAVDFHGVRIWRDIYYTRYVPPQDTAYGIGEPAAIPADSYMMLGDNSPDSSDSRYWGYVPRSHVIGRAFIVWWPPAELQALY